MSGSGMPILRLLFVEHFFPDKCQFALDVWSAVNERSLFDELLTFTLVPLALRFDRLRTKDPDLTFTDGFFL